MLINLVPLVDAHTRTGVYLTDESILAYHLATLTSAGVWAIAVLSPRLDDGDKIRPTERLAAG
jgi:hypothetical protein